MPCINHVSGPRSQGRGCNKQCCEKEPREHRIKCCGCQALIETIYFCRAKKCRHLYTTKRASDRTEISVGVGLPTLHICPVCIPRLKAVIYRQTTYSQVMGWRPEVWPEGTPFEYVAVWLEGRNVPTIRKRLPNANAT